MSYDFRKVKVAFETLTVEAMKNGKRAETELRKLSEQLKTRVESIDKEKLKEQLKTLGAFGKDEFKKLEGRLKDFEKLSIDLLETGKKLGAQSEHFVGDAKKKLQDLKVQIKTIAKEEREKRRARRRSS